MPPRKYDRSVVTDMARISTVCGVLAFAGSACLGTEPSAEQGAITPAQAATVTPAGQAAADSAAVERVERVPTPSVIRGLYVNRWAAVGRRINALIDVARTTEINSLVIDVKDDRGLVLYRSRVPLARRIGADTTNPMSLTRLRALLDTMRAHDIYPVARIVVVKDPLLAGARLDWAIKRRTDQQPWLDKNGLPWLDPHQREVWKYAADLAEEAYDLGFSEVQLDYVRFPDERRFVRETVFPQAQGRTRAELIREQLGYTRELLRKKDIRMTIDVFGLTATDTTDMGIGQKWELFVDQADAILPMNYPSHFAPGTYGIGNPNAQPYATIARAMQDVTRRTAPVRNAGRIIPWYQDFTMGPPRYGVAEVRAQIEAGYDNGYPDWILWNPGSRYTLGALKPKAALLEAQRRMVENSARRARADSMRADSLRRSPPAPDSAASVLQQPAQ
ncbi:MAG TPA: putative glycoside hydrolase [Gemmatimonadaceae bacterium]|nr:putative glycoside hydrolase [Gemmatimonadaceae bacterium]